MTASIAMLWPAAISAQDNADVPAAAEISGSEADEVHFGYLLDVELPLTSGSVERLSLQLKRFADSAEAGKRRTVVLKYTADSNANGESAFEDALKLARRMTTDSLRQIRVVSWVVGEIEGHVVLPIMASDMVVLNSSASLGNATKNESGDAEQLRLNYEFVARRRAIFPPAFVAAIADPAVELTQVETTDGKTVYATSDGLRDLRVAGNITKETVLSSANAPGIFSALTLRDASIAARIVQREDELAQFLDLAELRHSRGDLMIATPVGAWLDISGAISSNRARRWQSNLNATVEGTDTNTWLITLDSSGGDFGESAGLASTLSLPQPPIQTVAGFVRGDTRGDAALIGLACKPLWMKPGTTLGGPGADNITSEDVEGYAELITQVARECGRPEGLIRGLLDPTLQVYRYTNIKTGRVRYATREDLVYDVEDAAAELARWQRGELIDMSEGVSAVRAVELGLAEGEAPSIDAVSLRLGMDATPSPISDRGLVRFVERIGRSTGLAFLLLFVGFSCLSSEASAPGLGVPGFVATVCFALYFWIKFLAGTAEWLELLAFAIGLGCIAIEIFVVPGFGIFGIGGLALTILGVVLMSQTFVIPRNSFQVGELTKGLYVVLAGVGGAIGGLILMYRLSPNSGIFGHLVMEAPDAAAIDAHERISDYGHLVGQTGITSTPLRPAGKARFDDTIVAVVSDGSAVPKNTPVNVIEVHGNRIVVEAIEASDSDASKN